MAINAPHLAGNYHFHILAIARVLWAVGLTEKTAFFGAASISSLKTKVMRGVWAEL